MDAISYTKKNPLIKDVFAILLGLAGLYLFLFASILMGAIFLGYSVKLLLREGSEIDLSSKTYREMYSFFGLNFGKWKPFPQFEYISVFTTKEGMAAGMYGATITTVKTEIIHLNLFYNRNKHITIYRTYDKEDAFKVAKHFKMALNIDLFDATEKERKWL